jgi:Asp-tRNA(Asn)/Glu-tRNA(Gln) amidotransferase A subunit family amidase
MNDLHAEWHARSMTGLAAGLAAGEFSSVELTEALLERIARFDPDLNAFVTVTADEALAAAARADEARGSGSAGRCSTTLYRPMMQPLSNGSPRLVP